MKIHSPFIFLGFCAFVATTNGGELNHYQPSLSATRDFFVPSLPGFYYSQMDFTYLSDEFLDGSGHQPSEFTLSRTQDRSVTFDRSATLGLVKSKSSNFSFNFQGSILDFGATLDSSTELAASVSINAKASARLQAKTVFRAHLDDLDLRISAFSPTAIWVSEKKFFGARVAALASLPIVDMSIKARVKGVAEVRAQVGGQLSIDASSNLSATKAVTGSITATGPRGERVKLKEGSASLTASRSKSKTITKDFEGSLLLRQKFEYSISESGTDIGDIYVQPLWLGWSGKHYDLAVSNGVYLPTGRYAEGALNNTGMGFWTNQSRVAAAWYPWESKATAISLATTYEMHGNKEGVDIRPGSNLTVNWGVSQYLPLNKKQTWLADIGVGGYDIWQVSDDRGRDVTYDAGVHDEVHAVGIQIGLAQAEWNAALTLRWMHEYAARDRFMGDMFVLNFAKKF